MAKNEKSKTSNKGGKGGSSKVKDNNGNDNKQVNVIHGNVNDRSMLFLGAAVFVLLFAAAAFGFRNYRSINDTFARVICERRPDDRRCQERDRPVDPIDPRCEKRPNHPRCQPTNPPGGGGTPPVDDKPPLPPTKPPEANRVMSGAVNESGGFTVPAGEVWVFDPTKNTTVEVQANVVVYGVLEMRPNPGVKHTLRFKNVNESIFGGGGLEVLRDDVGLWVMGDGILDIEGEKKTGWNRTGTDPTWKASDELKVAPISRGDHTFKNYSLGNPVPQLHSSLPKAEVINLTRSVNIEGTTQGYSHVMFRSSQPQRIKYAAFRYMGVGSTLGRYPLHFHFMNNGSRGTIVEGTVIRDAGAHAYVAHASHGVTFRDTVAYNITDSAYWWDPIKGTGSKTENATDDIVYDKVIAAQVRAVPAASGRRDAGGTRVSGFSLVAGKGGVVRDSAAVAVQGSSNSSGFEWPPNDIQSWVFNNNVAHNNTPFGIWIWHNDGTYHLIENFVGYSNGNARGVGGGGILTGAYNNNYEFRNIYLYGNNRAIEIHAGSNGQKWVNVTLQNNTENFWVSNASAPKWPLPFSCLRVNGVVQTKIDPRLNITGC